MTSKLRPNVKWEWGKHSDRILKCRFAVKSPGIAPHSEMFERLRKAHIPVFSELEVALSFCRCQRVIAITGTNGKTTTTLLTAAVFKAARKKVHVAGNLGIPLSSLVSKIKRTDILVLEVSSYQLEDSQYFRPDSAAILNVTADHVEHHGSMDRYVLAKGRVFGHQHRRDVCVFNGDDPLAAKLSRSSPSRRLYFSRHHSTLSHAWIQDGKIFVRLPGTKKEARLAAPALPGIHNQENAMAAALLALDAGIQARAIQKAFKNFVGVEHRIEDLGVVRGIRCINDSKATNVESTLTALRALERKDPRILLVLGGLHKGYPYSPLRPYLGTSVKGILTIGSSARKIEEDLGGAVPIFPCATLASAVHTAFQVGTKGDVLLLSPACASFDQFRDFEERGQIFKELIHKVKQGK